MADRRVNTITVSSRTIDLAGEILVIPQIVRLRELDYAIRRGLSGGRVVLLIVGVVVLVAGPSFPGIGPTGSGGEPLTIAALALVLGVLLYSFYTRTRYILAIELASGSISGLSAADPTALNRLKNDIQQVIELPPRQPTLIHTGDVWAVDARGSRGNNQFGSGNQQFNS